MNIEAIALGIFCLVLMLLLSREVKARQALLMENRKLQLDLLFKSVHPDAIPLDVLKEAFAEERELLKGSQ